VRRIGGKPGAPDPPGAGASPACGVGGGFGGSGRGSACSPAPSFTISYFNLNVRPAAVATERREALEYARSRARRINRQPLEHAVEVVDEAGV
jgi:hypothetical protein